MAAYALIFVKEHRIKPYEFMILLKYHKSRREYSAI